MHAPKGSGGFVGPYVWFKNSNFDARFVPLLYTDVLRRADGQHLTQVGPWFRVEGPGYKSQGILPLFGHYADAKESDTWIVPSYFRMRRTNGDRVDTLLPLFWHSSFGGRRTTIVGPYFERTTPDCPRRRPGPAVSLRQEQPAHDDRSCRRSCCFSAAPPTGRAPGSPACSSSTTAIPAGR